MRVPKVEDCYVIENTTDTAVGNCDPYSFECVVLYDGEASTKKLIAEAIFGKKPIGIATSGLNSVTVTDDAKKNHTIKFTDTTRVYVGVQATIHKNSEFPNDGVEQIKERLMDYINSLGNGETLYVSKLYACMHIEGVNFVSSIGIQKQTDPAPTAQSLTFNNDEVARTKSDYISITISR